MDHGVCNVVYLDRRARENETVKRDTVPAYSGSSTSGTSSPRRATGYFDLGRGRAGEVQANLQAILSTFTEGESGTGRSHVQMLRPHSHLMDTDVSQCIYAVQVKNAFRRSPN